MLLAASQLMTLLHLMGLSTIEKTARPAAASKCNQLLLQSLEGPLLLLPLMLALPRVAALLDSTTVSSWLCPEADGAEASTAGEALALQLLSQQLLLSLRCAIRARAPPVWPWLPGAAGGARMLAAAV
jgi:hypothetical protein